MSGCRFDGQRFHPTDISGADLYDVEKIIRTPQGSVKQYDVTFPGVMVEPSATNYLLNSATPATQTTGSLGTGAYCLWVTGGGSAEVSAGTATITGAGTATEGTHVTFTVTGAGTVTVTVTGTLTHFQLEASFQTSKIVTTTGTVTRQSDNITFSTPAWLMNQKNNFAIIMRVIPKAAGQTKYSFSSYTNANGAMSIYVEPTQISLRKRSSGSNTDAAVSYTHVKDTPFEIVAYVSSRGMGITTRAYSGGWGAWAAVGTNANTADAPISSLVNIGSTGNVTDGFSGHLCSGVSMTRILKIPSNLTSAAALQAWLQAKAGV